MITRNHILNMFNISIINITFSENIYTYQICNLLGQMENGFLHFDTLAFQNTQTRIEMNRQWEVCLHGNHHE